MDFARRRGLTRRRPGPRHTRQGTGFRLCRGLTRYRSFTLCKGFARRKGLHAVTALHGASALHASRALHSTKASQGRRPPPSPPPSLTRTRSPVRRRWARAAQDREKIRAREAIEASQLMCLPTEPARPGAGEHVPRRTVKRCGRVCFCPLSAHARAQVSTCRKILNWRTSCAC